MLRYGMMPARGDRKRRREKHFEKCLDNKWRCVLCTCMIVYREHTKMNACITNP